MKKIVAVILCVFTFQVYIIPNERKIPPEIISGLDTLKTDTLRINKLNQISSTYFLQDPVISKLLSDSALRLARSTSNERGKSFSYMIKGLGFYYQAKYDTSLLYYDSSLIYPQAVDDSVAFSAIYNNIGLVYQAMAKYPEALDAFYRSLYYCGDNQRMISSIKGNIGLVYYNQNEYHKAKKIWLEELDFATSENNLNNMATTSYQLASTYKELEILDSAKYYAAISEKVCAENNFAVQKTINDKLLAEIYLIEGDYANAKNYADLSLEAALNNQNDASAAYAYYMLMKIFLKQNNLKQALKYGEKAVEYADKSESNSVLLNSYDKISEIFENMGNHRTALKYHKLYKEISDTVYNERKSGQIKEMEAKYESEKKEQQISLLEAQTELKEAESRQNASQRNWMILLAIVLFMGVLVVVYYLRKTADAKRRIEHLQREIHHRVKNNLAIIRRMTEVAVESVGTKSPEEVLSGLNGRIDSIARLHTQLYENRDVTRIDAGTYLKNLSEDISHAFGKSLPKFKEKVEQHGTGIRFSKIVTLGLIVNELITNAYKYGGENPEVSMEMYFGKETSTITISDHGPGFRNGFDPARSESYGLKLVHGLVRQLDGEIHFANRNGAVVEISLPAK